jgi:hypothetical protein
METFDELITSRSSLDAVENYLIGVCDDLQYIEVLNKTVCPIVKLMGDDILPSLAKFYLGPDYFCSNRMLNYCSSPSFQPLTVEDYQKDQLALKPKTLSNNDYIQN